MGTDRARNPAGALTAVVAAALAVAMAAGLAPGARPGPAPGAATPTPRPAAASLPGMAATPVPHPNAWFEAGTFFHGLRVARGEVPAPAASAPPLAGGVVPHHLLAGHLLSDFFLDLGRHPPATVILVGPNHDNRGARMATSRLGWATPFGTVDADLDLVRELVRAGLATPDDGALAPEHSVGGLMPYIAYHLPGARVVPLILHGDVTLAEARALAGALAPLLGPDRVLVASVDFSHYLTRAQAEARDRETLAAMQAHDLERLYRMGNDHLDSPPSLAVLMEAMALARLRGPEWAGHTNSGVLLGNDFIETTSYFLLKYRRAGGSAAGPGG